MIFDNNCLNWSLLVFVIGIDFANINKKFISPQKKAKNLQFLQILKQKLQIL